MYIFVLLLLLLLCKGSLECYIAVVELKEGTGCTCVCPPHPSKSAKDIDTLIEPSVKCSNRTVAMAVHVYKNPPQLVSY